MLTEEARINRKTFYLHYNSLEDLLMECRLQTISTGVERVLSYVIPQDLRKMIYSIYEYWQSLTETDRRIWFASSDGDLSFYQQMQQRYSNFAPDFLADDPAGRQMALAFAVRGMGGVYNEWITNYPDMPIEKVVDTAYRLISKGIAA